MPVFRLRKEALSISDPGLRTALAEMSEPQGPRRHEKSAAFLSTHIQPRPSLVLRHSHTRCSRGAKLVTDDK